MNLEEGLKKMSELQSDLKEAERIVMMKSGQLNDLMKELAVDHLGFDKDTKEFPLVDLLERTYLKGKQ